ncbi:deoxyribodipyrimidine photo-lyase/cryptochrome family protein [Phaeobacter sp. CNT1-3]|nr:deoxyribodipyrimidine photo-lyase/cryptochrome family protein [Phaeobacter sp. CNT1-3]
MQVLWLKRDLRVQDHQALVRAAAEGDVLPLYVLEREYWRLPDTSARQLAFTVETLAELRRDFAALGQPLVVQIGDVVEVLETLRRDGKVTALWSHEETGNDWTYQRDRRVARWCRDHGIRWTEVQQFGVWRRLSSRSGWAHGWDRMMAMPAVTSPPLGPVNVDAGPLPSVRDLQLEFGMRADPCPDRQPAGRRVAEGVLQSFLQRRGRSYRWAMSSPLEGAQACSRLSPHLAVGALSMREAAQATWARQRQLADMEPRPDPSWQKSMTSFVGRLHWHCHFIQKLEDAPEIEFQNLHRAYDGLRPSAPDADRLAAWAAGETGLPFVDACMRCLRATGWLNFRMRAMVMSVAAYHLWLDWRAPGLVLARRFTDYEPGIHWSQVQMQSGTTGINTIRIYNPVKQGRDQDPTGAFTRRWLPELAPIADHHLQEPWMAENAAAILGKVYPHPIIDPQEAARHARDRVWAVRRSDGFRDEAGNIVAKHASRKPSPRRRASSRQKATPSGQMSFKF